MSKGVRFGGAFILFCCVLFPITNETRLSLPIRVIENPQRPEELNKDNVHLLINGSPRDIAQIIRRERSLSGVPDLGRQIILSFHNIKGSAPIENMISYFVAEILDPKDTLLLLSPIKAYRIPVVQDKQKMTTDICQILNEDFAVHRKNRISAEKNLEYDLQRLNRIASDEPAEILPGGTRDPEQTLSQITDLATNYKTITQILLNFPHSFTSFKNQYLLPDTIRNQKIKELLGKNWGENWWIHFQHREDAQIIHKARSAASKLNSYIGTHESGTLARTIQKSLADFEKELLVSTSFPFVEILDTMLRKNICFNVVHWGSLRSDESDTSFEEISDLEAVLDRIAENSGGKDVVATDPEQGIKEIRNHKDIFYDLNFAFDGEVEEKKIQIFTDRPSLVLSYKQNFSREEMQEWIAKLTEKKVAICDMAVREKMIHFEIESFREDRDKHFGLLKVRISLFDMNSRNVFKSEKTLRASKQRVAVSVPLPPEHRGKFLLVIEVFDLLANTSASSELSIEL